MSRGIISLIAISIIIGVLVFGYLINKGTKLCNENNTFGVLLLFFGLNIFGLILGCCIISNIRYKEKKTLYDKINNYLDKQEKDKSTQSN